MHARMAGPVIEVGGWSAKLLKPGVNVVRLCHFANTLAPVNTKNPG